MVTQRKILEKIGRKGWNAEIQICPILQSVKQMSSQNSPDMISPKILNLTLEAFLMKLGKEFRTSKILTLANKWSKMQDKIKRF